MIVVSVMPPYDGELRLVGVKNVAATLREPYEKALAQSENIARAEGVRIYPVLEQGEPHERIVELAQAERCNLIVVGVRGCNPTEKALMGSMAARIIGYSRTNVLIVPREAEIRWNKVLVAIDGSESGRMALSPAFYLQNSYGSKVTLLTVADVPSPIYGIDPSVAEGFIGTARKVLEEAAKEANTMGIHAESYLGEGDPADVMTEFAQKEHADLILMGSHGRTGLGRLLMGSVAERVIGHAPCPVLITRG